MKKAHFQVALCVFLCVFCFKSFSETASPPKRVAVLNSTDSTGSDFGPALQQALVILFQQTAGYEAGPVAEALPSFNEKEIENVFAKVTADLMCFSYLEAERVTLFLFDKTRPKQFVTTTQPLVDAMLGNQVTPQVIEYKLRVAFNQLISLYTQEQFQSLPNQQASLDLETTDPVKRAEISRRLFREMATLNESKYYIGATIGMARFSGGPSSNSMLNFGVVLGTSTSERVNLELGLEIFNYMLVDVMAKYRFPVGERYISLFGSIGLGRVVGTVFGPRPGIPDAFLAEGQFMYGPGFTFDIPLLGASLRGDIKLFFGAGLTIFGSYGIAYNI